MTKNLKGRNRNNIVKLPAPKVCRYCGGHVEFVNNSQVYGKPCGRWPYVYLCQHCGAKIGVHPGTEIPLGTLANKGLQQARVRAHRAFDALWRSGVMKRSRAYRLLSRKLGIPADRCHIGMFDYEECRRAEQAIKEIINERTERNVA